MVPVSKMDVGQSSLLGRIQRVLGARTGETDMSNSHGRFVWYELMTSDVEAAKAFYAEVVGWGTKGRLDTWEGLHPCSPPGRSR